MIYFKNIELKYDGKILFDNFSMKVEEGKKFAVKGRSGKGKTSLFNMLMGFLKPDAGEIYFDGILINRDEIPKVRSKIAWLPQNPDLIGRGSVREQLDLIFDFSLNREIKPSYEDLKSELIKLNMDGSILGKTFDELSGGEKQRLGLLVCKLLRKPVILLDEPTSALDKENLESAANYMLKGNGDTVISASHDEEWLKKCDKVIEI